MTDSRSETDSSSKPGDDVGTVAGVLLAAGTSSRFGAANKLLAELDGTPIVVHAVETLLESRLEPVVVVIGHEAGRLEAALEGYPVECVRNPAYAAGQSTSVTAGVAALEGQDVDAAVFALGDMPFVEATSVEVLISTWRDGNRETTDGDRDPTTAVVAAYEGVRGNPVLFDSGAFERLKTLAGDRGGRRLLRDGDGVVLVETGDPGVRRDVDTPRDLTG